MMPALHCMLFPFILGCLGGGTLDIGFGGDRVMTTNMSASFLLLLFLLLLSSAFLIGWVYTLCRALSHCKKLLGLLDTFGVRALSPCMTSMRAPLWTAFLVDMSVGVRRPS
jgi:hypothetical protein